MIVLFLASAVAITLAHSRRSKCLPSHQLRAQTKLDMTAALDHNDGVQDTALQAAAFVSAAYVAGHGADSRVINDSTQQRRAIHNERLPA